MNMRSRSHHAAHAGDDRPAEVPEMELVHRGSPDLVTTGDALARLLATLRADGVFAYDSEFISERSYHPQLCLVQVSSRSALALIDPLAGVDMRPFWELLADPAVTKIVHSGASDIEPVLRHLGRPAAGVFDTQIAAGFIGLPYPMSLKKLVLELTGANLGSDLGFSDWQKRPLSPVQVRYAADDVRYLPAAHRELCARLAALGHAESADEECAATCEAGRFGFNPETHYQRVRGIGALSLRSMAVLKALAAWRDAAARRADKPPRTLLKDEVLLELARERPVSVAALGAVRGLPRAVAAGCGTDIMAAVGAACALPDSDLPAPEPAMGAGDKVRVDALAAELARLCAAASLDPGLVTSRKGLDRFYRHVAAGIGETPALLQGWRRAAVGERLRVFLLDPRSPAHPAGTGG